MTIAQAAARLNAMADEVAEIAKDILPHVRNETRDDLAFNVHAVVGGNCGNLRRAARDMMALDRELQQ